MHIPLSISLCLKYKKEGFHERGSWANCILNTKSYLACSPTAVKHGAAGKYKYCILSATPVIFIKWHPCQIKEPVSHSESRYDLKVPPKQVVNTDM